MTLPQPTSDAVLYEKRDALEFVKETTLDQLLTFLYVCKLGSLSQAAKALGRDLTTVKGMVEKLERRFEPISREALFMPSPSRGGEITLTATGYQLERMCEKITNSIRSTTSDLQATTRKPRIRIGLTTFMVEILKNVDAIARPMLAKAGFNVTRELQHIQSQDITKVVENGEVSLSLGGLTSENIFERPKIDPSLEVKIYDQQRFGILSNYATKLDEAHIDHLSTYNMPLILPSKGGIRQLIDGRFTNPIEELTIVELSNDVYFSLDTLTFADEDLCMIGTRPMAQKLEERLQSNTRRRKSKASNRQFFFKEFTDISWGVTIALFRRRFDKPIYSDSHPLSIYWQAFEQSAAKDEASKHTTKQ